jgi:hypothetical protein
MVTVTVRPSNCVWAVARRRKWTPLTSSNYERIESTCGSHGKVTVSGHADAAALEENYMLSFTLFAIRNLTQVRRRAVHRVTVVVSARSCWLLGVRLAVSVWFRGKPVSRGSRRARDTTA